MQILGSQICTAHNSPSVLAGASRGRGPRPDLSASNPAPFPPDLWSYGLSPAVPAASYETFDPAVATFGHPQGVQLCYGPSTYSPVGNLDPAPSLEAPGPGFPAYPTEDFTSQVRAGETVEVPYPLIEVPGTASEPEHIGNPSPL